MDAKSKKRQLPSTLSEVTTPCFLVDIDRLKSNASRMLDTCRRLSVDLRSHTKTHKTVEAAEILSGGTRRKIACSTLAECEMYAENGFDDILLAYPISAEKIPRCAQLVNSIGQFHVLVSGEEGVQCLEKGAGELTAGRQWSVFMELDCGAGRTGFPCSSDSKALVQAAKDVHSHPCMKLQGLYTFCGGQLYEFKTPDQRKEGQKKLVDHLLGAANRLRAEGVDVPVVGTGSTPTCSLPEPVLGQLDEFHPGNYVFYDYEQLLLGVCKEEDIAVCVATRVVCHRRDLNTLIVDCGFLGIGHDGKAQRGHDFCLIKGHPELRMTYNSQELGKIKATEGKALNVDHYPVGTMFFIYPYHSCATAALHDHYLVHSGQKIVDVWRPVKGW